MSAQYPNFNLSHHSQEQVRRQTPLHTAVEDDLIDDVRALLDNGANVNAQNEEGFTPPAFSYPRKRFAIYENIAR